MFHCIEGNGRVVVEDQTLEFRVKDTFVVPSWREHRFQADGECVLFSFSDRPIQRALSLWREALVS